MIDKIEQYRELVEKAANSLYYRIKGKAFMDKDDLIQAGYIGLMGGLKRMKPERGERNFLWATVYLRILREIITHNHVLYAGERFKIHANRMYKSDNVDPEYWAKELGVTLDLAKDMLRYLATSYLSFDYDKFGDDGREMTSLHDLVPAVDETEEWEQAWENVFARFCKTELQKQILRHMYDGYNQREIALLTGYAEHTIYKNYRYMRERGMQYETATPQKAQHSPPPA